MVTPGTYPNPGYKMQGVAACLRGPCGGDAASCYTRSRARSLSQHEQSAPSVCPGCACLSASLHPQTSLSQAGHCRVAFSSWQDTGGRHLRSLRSRWKLQIPSCASSLYQIWLLETCGLFCLHSSLPSCYLLSCGRNPMHW